jgi:hypothetical protein
MSDLEKFEYIHWLLSELLHEDKTEFINEVDQAMQILEDLREKEFKGAIK